MLMGRQVPTSQTILLSGNQAGYSDWLSGQYNGKSAVQWLEIAGLSHTMWSEAGLRTHSYTVSNFLLGLA